MFILIYILVNIINMLKSHIDNKDSLFLHVTRYQCQHQSNYLKNLLQHAEECCHAAI
jgi:hypothetical protein